MVKKVDMARGVFFKYVYRGFFVNVFDRLIHTIIAIVLIPRDWEGIDNLGRDIKRYGERFARTSEFLLDNSICFLEVNECGTKAVIQYYFRQRGDMDRLKMKSVYNDCIDGLIDLIKEESIGKQQLKIRTPNKDYH